MFGTGMGMRKNSPAEVMQIRFCCVSAHVLVAFRPVRHEWRRVILSSPFVTSVNGSAGSWCCQYEVKVGIVFHWFHLRVVPAAHPDSRIISE